MSPPGAGWRSREGKPGKRGVRDQGFRYLRLDPVGSLPDVPDGGPFKAMLASDAPVDASRREAICRWLVVSGCRYLVPFGRAGEAWCESLRAANLGVFDLDSIEPADFVMATSHPYESLRSVMWFAKTAARHPEHTFTELVVLHVSSADRPGEFRAAFERV